MTCGTREQARAGVGTGSHPRTGNPDLEGNAISSVTGKNEKLEKQKAEKKKTISTILGNLGEGC